MFNIRLVLATAAAALAASTLVLLPAVADGGQSPTSTVADATLHLADNAQWG
ncbi:hypothetical protein [Streptomyces sp. CBMA156]|uniref:hypothetical protein n=1 Tax=Streptomyces sp. CBMA156 TaxID=1930280 RepID=UPI001661B6B5|nr:hypothetical protein [Streptomyces sp. CBMA156]